jgi:RNA polymerase sigma-70 factor (ECF subfamily)
MSSESTPPERPETISQWIAAARAGNDQALGRLLEACQLYLMQVANGEMESRLQAKVGASDIVQETYLEAQRIFDRFQGSSPTELRAWLRAILLNKLATAARQYRATAKRQMGREVPIDPTASQPIDPAGPAATASSIMAREERMQALMAALGRLPEDYRKIILWRQVENLAFEEMAKRLGRSLDAVRKLWWRALKSLQQELGEAH